MKTHYIWNPETGITDLNESWEGLRATELVSLQKMWAEQQERLRGTRRLQQFTEQMGREWAIETGIIENLYQIERGITQTLIERGFQAEFLTRDATDKQPGYVLNLIRDQKDALDGVFDFIRRRRNLTTSYIKELHAALVRSQEFTEGQNPDGRMVQIPLIRGDWKLQPNFPIRDDVVFAYCPPEHVASEMDRLVDLHQKHIAMGVTPDVEAAWLHHRFSQIHPFQDGNGRVARALASMILIRAGLFPLIVTRDDKRRYLDALEAADAGDLQPMVDIFAALQRTQFRKLTAASENLLSVSQSIPSAMDKLKQIAASRGTPALTDKSAVFDHAVALEADLKSALETLVPDLQEVVVRLDPKGSAYVSGSTPETSHYHLGNVFKNAQEHMSYFADTNSYRSWLALVIRWRRTLRLIFHFHGIGRPFSGSLVCAAFLELRDSDGDGQVQSSILPVAEEPFIFFYDEPREAIRNRFKTWRENVVTVALKQLGEAI